MTTLWTQYLSTASFPVRPMPHILEYLRIGGITTPWCVYVKQDRWGTYDGAQTIAHEGVHVAQQRGMGKLRFYLRWAFSRAWRKSLETQAYAASIEFDYRHCPSRVPSTTEWAVDALTSSATWWACRSRQEAYIALLRP